MLSYGFVIAISLIHYNVFEIGLNSEYSYDLSLLLCGSNTILDHLFTSTCIT